MNNSKLITVGKFGSSYGIQGWIKVISYTKPIENLLQLKPWFIATKNKHSILPLEIDAAKIHGKFIIAKLSNCSNIDDTTAYTNMEILVERNQLPPLPNNQYYWVDLEGLRVINTANIELGIIDHIMETGANDVIVVRNNNKERLIPYLKQIIVKVDLSDKLMIVDWNEDL